MRWWLWRLIGVMTVSPPGVFAQEPVRTAADIHELRALAAARLRPSYALALSYETFQDPLDDRSGGNVSHIWRNILVDVSTGRYRIDRSIQTERDDAERDHLISFGFDGEVQSSIAPDRQIAVVREGSELQPLVESGLWGVMLLGEPQPSGFGIDDGSLESLLAHGVLRDELEIVGDAACHVVDAYANGARYATVWVDVDRDLLPMKRVTYSVDGTPSATTTVEVAALLEEDGIWIPQRWVTEMNIRGQTASLTTIVALDSVQIDPPVDDADFRIEFPPGTVVTDHIAGIAYVVSDNGGIGQVVYEIGEDGWAPIEQPGTVEERSYARPVESVTDVSGSPAPPGSVNEHRVDERRHDDAINSVPQAGIELDLDRRPSVPNPKAGGAVRHAGGEGDLGGEKTVLKEFRSPDPAKNTPKSRRSHVPNEARDSRAPASSSVRRTIAGVFGILVLLALVYMGLRLSKRS
ncbi:MAG: hypothetical protein D6744_18435 [Planctomycetota bacterium]|nr:MAG: hypothetical protein D6744_18435 [Planctomycetota bacterium]